MLLQNFIFHIFIYKDVIEVLSFFCERNIKIIFLISFFCARNIKIIFFEKGLPNLPNKTSPGNFFFQVFCKQTRWIVCQEQNDKIDLKASFEESLLLSHVNRSKKIEGSLLWGIVAWYPLSLWSIEVLKIGFYVLINYYYINKMQIFDSYM